LTTSIFNLLTDDSPIGYLQVNHADLCHERGSRIIVFRHNDVADLERRMAAISHPCKKLVAVYPAVEWTNTGVRFMVTALHTEEYIAETLASLKKLAYIADLNVV